MARAAADHSPAALRQDVVFATVPGTGRKLLCDLWQPQPVCLLRSWQADLAAHYDPTDQQRSCRPDDLQPDWNAPPPAWLPPLHRAHPGCPPTRLVHGEHARWRPSPPSGGCTGGWSRRACR